MDEACSIHCRAETCLQILVRRPEKKSTFWRPRYKCEGNIKINVEGVGCGTWTELYLLHYIVLNVMDTEHTIRLTDLAMDFSWVH
jgi:hypothetical protein